MNGRSRIAAWLRFGLIAGAFLVLVFVPPALRGLLALLFPNGSNLLYPRADISLLVGEHVAMSAISSLLAAVVGIAAGITATRPWAGSFALVADRLAAAGQTIPPAAVLVLSVPALGFGLAPTVAALFLYSILPILRNTMSGLAGVDRDVVEAAAGMGMGPLSILFKVELPLAAPVIIAGIRTAVIVNIGTATIGATIGAGGLGAPIIAGLVNQKPSFLAEGALVVALLALVLDSLFAAIAGELPAQRATQRAAAHQAAAQAASTTTGTTS